MGFYIFLIFLSFIYWFNLCKLNLYLWAPELTFPHSENSAFKQSQFSIIQWLVPQSSARIIHASGCFSYSECFHFGCFAYCDFFLPQDQQWWNTRYITLTTLPSNIRLSALRQSVFWLQILPLMSQKLSLSQLFPNL